MTPEEHMYFKKACAKIRNIYERIFTLSCFREHPGEIEDEWLAEIARETFENIRSGKERAISWEEMKKRIT